MVLDDLVREFNQLPEEEQRLFLARIMPAVRRLFLSDPGKMMAEIMPFCREIMSQTACDMGAMMDLMRDSLKR